ncbi:hypothetical protein MINTM020_00990 [Mycobacterium paraintracellulare]|nr:hypothetical protein [Mycobacterium paraintracellulare]BCP08001.1 hypothetical protein MINTM020_00990 [Mycobacterium paraintracellulare]
MNDIEDDVRSLSAEFEYDPLDGFCGLGMDCAAGSQTAGETDHVRIWAGDEFLSGFDALTGEDVKNSRRQIGLSDYFGQHQQ